MSIYLQNTFMYLEKKVLDCFKYLGFQIKFQSHVELINNYWGKNLGHNIWWFFYSYFNFSIFNIVDFILEIKKSVKIIYLGTKVDFKSKQIRNNFKKYL